MEALARDLLNLGGLQSGGAGFPPTSANKTPGFIGWAVVESGGMHL